MELIYYYINPKKKKLEQLFAWAQFYQGGLSFIGSKPRANDKAFLKIQREIEELMKEMYKSI